MRGRRSTAPGYFQVAGVEATAGRECQVQKGCRRAALRLIEPGKPTSILRRIVLIAAFATSASMNTGLSACLMLEPSSSLGAASTTRSEEMVRRANSYWLDRKKVTGSASAGT